MGHDENVFRRANPHEPLVSLLDQRRTGAKDIDELLRAGTPAHGPEAAPDPPGHDDAVVVGHVLVVGCHWLSLVVIGCH